MRIFSLNLSKKVPGRNRKRRIIAPPRFGGFKPYGCPPNHEAPIQLLFEEYEAIKLADYKLMNHQEAAVLMGVSRATFARIYEKARRKIAQALVETKTIETITGNSYTNKNWYYCGNCHARFSLPISILEKNCPICRSVQIETLI